MNRCRGIRFCPQWELSRGREVCRDRMDATTALLVASTSVALDCKCAHCPGDVMSGRVGNVWST